MSSSSSSKYWHFMMCRNPSNYQQVTKAGVPFLSVILWIYCRPALCFRLCVCCIVVHCWYLKCISAVCTYCWHRKHIKDILLYFLAHRMKDTWEFHFSHHVSVAILKQHCADSWTACSKTASGTSGVHREFITTCPKFSRKRMFLLVRTKPETLDVMHLHG